MVTSLHRSGSIHEVRVLGGVLVHRVEIRRQLLRLRFDEHGPAAFDQPAGVGHWHKARASDLPEVALFLAERAASIN
jgi:hypothetical protein